MDSRLYRCASRGDVRSLKRLLKETPSLILRLTPQGNSIVHIASRLGHGPAVQEICRRCKSLLTKPKADGDTTPHASLVFNHIGEFPLYLAAKSRMAEIVNRILMFLSAPSGVCHGQSALHGTVIERHPASSGDHNMLERLRGFDFLSAYAMDRNGHSPLHAAALSGHRKANVVSNMLNMVELEGLINQHDKNVYTPLHLAAMERDSWIMRYFLWDERVDQRARNRSGPTALNIIKPIEHPTMITARTFWRQPHNMDTPYWSFLKKADSSPNQEDDGASEQTCTQRGQTLLMVAVLLTAVTFLAAFTMPGGYNNNLVQTKEWPFCSRANFGPTERSMSMDEVRRPGPLSCLSLQFLSSVETFQG
ncbi:hypothetical protein CRG98_046937 [Punica granatum]|uniref:PGG domain-containing protein n=1 Tax=Punica granatum TaxID=22663 RepID=A0A2I0HLR6_PUNGR|nr:hypothetical protein CRG98_046937 [Punica granatum]